MAQLTINNRDGLESWILEFRALSDQKKIEFLKSIKTLDQRLIPQSLQDEYTKFELEYAERQKKIEQEKQKKIREEKEETTRQERLAQEQRVIKEQEQAQINQLEKEKVRKKTKRAIIWSCALALVLAIWYGVVSVEKNKQKDLREQKIVSILDKWWDFSELYNLLITHWTLKPGQEWVCHVRSKDLLIKNGVILDIYDSISKKSWWIYVGVKDRSHYILNDNFVVLWEKYEKIEWDRILVCKKNDKNYYYYDSKNNMFRGPYEYLGSFNDWLSLKRYWGKFYYMNMDFDNVLWPYEWAQDFKDWVAQIMEWKNIYYIGTDWKIRLNDDERKYSFSGWVELTKRLGMFYLINKKWEILSGPYSNGERFETWYSQIYDNGDWYVLNKKGKKIHGPLGAKVYFSEWLAVMKKKWKKYYVDKSFDTVLGPYESAGDFSEWLAIVNIWGEKYYINRIWKKILWPYLSCEAFSEWRALIREEMGLGRKVVNWVSDKLSFNKIVNTWEYYYIDKAWDVVAGPYSNWGAFNKWKAKVWDRGDIYYIDKDWRRTD